MYQQPPYYSTPPSHPAYPPVPAGPPPYSLQRPSRAPWLLFLLVLGAAGAGAYWTMQDREALVNQLRAAREETAAVRRDLEGRVSQLEADKAALATSRDELAKNVEQTTSELETLKGTQDKLHEQMKDEIARGDIALSSQGGRLRVDLVDKILFDSGAAKISKRGEGVLTRLGAVLAAIDDKQIQVSGHTDRTPISGKLAGTFPTNWELSVLRATNVVRFLQDGAKVPADRLVASGYGENHPIASNKTAAGRARNRRIEILLTPSLHPKRISRAALAQKAEEAEDGPSTKQAGDGKKAAPTERRAARRQ